MPLVDAVKAEREDAKEILDRVYVPRNSREDAECEARWFGLNEFVQQTDFLER